MDKKKIVISNIRSVHYRNIHPDGISVTNSPSDKNEIHLYLYSERYQIPDQIIYEQNESNIITKDSGTNADINLTREYEAAVVFSLADAKDIVKKLQDIINSIENA